MPSPRLALGAASLALAISSVGLAGTAYADPTPRFSPQPDCDGTGSYPAAAGEGFGQGVSDTTLDRLQEARATSGCSTLPPGAAVTVRIFNANQSFDIASGNVGADGNFSTDFTTPQCIANGDATIQFVSGNETVNLPVEIVGGSTEGCEGVLGANGEFVGGGSGGAGGGGTTTSGSAGGRVAGVLPRTGADTLLPLGIGGGVLVLAGAGMVVAARRRNSDLPGSAA